MRKAVLLAEELTIAVDGEPEASLSIEEHQTKQKVIS